MGLKEQIEKNAVVIFLTAVVAGFMAGYGAHDVIIRSGRMEVLSRTEVLQFRADRSRLADKEREIISLKQQLARYSAWPPMFTQIQKAELKLSDADDRLVVKVNGQGEFSAGFGEVVPPFQIKELLRSGSNDFHIKIVNTGGPCSGTVTVILNGVEAERWSVVKSGRQDNPCFEQSRNLELR
jgi:hypothetical protein